MENALATLEDSLRCAFVFGSVARGREHHASDVDLLVVGDVLFADVVHALVAAEERLEREINPTVYSENEFRRKLRAHNHFLTRLLAEPKVFLIGGERDLARLAQQRMAR